MVSVWSEVQTCIWPSWCHCHSLSLASVKSRLVLPFWYRLTRVVPDKGPLNVCQFYQTTLGNCYGLKLSKCWLQLKNNLCVIYHNFGTAFVPYCEYNCYDWLPFPYILPVVDLFHPSGLTLTHIPAVPFLLSIFAFVLFFVLFYSFSFFPCISFWAHFTVS